MRILLVASAFNSLTQRVQAELAACGHELDVVPDGDQDAVREGVLRHVPELIIAPMLKTALPEDVWSEHTCLIVHPGPPGDRGPSSLDWAVETGADAVGGHRAAGGRRDGRRRHLGDGSLRDAPGAGKSDIYRNEAADAAMAAVMLAVERFASGRHKPQPQRTLEVDPVWRPYFGQDLRRIDWSADSTATVLRKLRAADSQPGVLDELLGAEWFLHGGRPEDELRGAPGEILATRAGAVCRATRDGAVWIPQLRPRRTPGGPSTFKRPAVARPRRPASPRTGDSRTTGDTRRTRTSGATSATSRRARWASSGSPSPAAR